MNRGESWENIQTPRSNAEPIYDKSDSAKCVEGIELLYNLVWTIVFWVKIGGTEQATCASQVWFWANYAKYYFLIATIISTISTCCFFNPPAKGSFIDRIKLDTIVNILFGAVRFAGAILVIGFLVTYTQVEACAELSTIMLIQFWIIVAIFVTGAALCVCSVYCLRGDVKVLKSQKSGTFTSHASPHLARSGSLTDNLNTLMRMASRRDDYSPV